MVLKKRVAEWGISTAHFDPYAASNEALKRAPKPLAEILVRDSTYCRSNLNQRLYDAGLKQRQCELCGQGELWRARRMGLILDHINGVRDDTNATARVTAGRVGIGRGYPDLVRERSSDRRASSFWPRSMNTATSEWVGGTESQTMQCGSGCAITSASRRSPRAGIQPWSRSLGGRGRTGAATGRLRSCPNRGCRPQPSEQRHASPAPTIPR